MMNHQINDVEGLETGDEGLPGLQQPCRMCGDDILDNLVVFKAFLDDAPEQCL